MRGLGAFIFLFGIFLCLSIAGAPAGIFFVILGFFMVVLGGGRRKVVIHNIVNVNSPPAVSGNLHDIPKASFWKRGGRQEPKLVAPPRLATAASELIYEPELRTINPEPYDRAKWRALVEYDPDISRVVAALSPYGQKYVDQLAKAYLALNDKDYLPMIVQKIIATARTDSQQSPQRQR